MRAYLGGTSPYAVLIEGGFSRRDNLLSRKDPLLPTARNTVSLVNTNGRPKSCLDIATVPNARILIESIKLAGISDFFVTTHYLHDQIEEYFRRGEGYDLGVKELWNEKIALGTAPGTVMNLLVRPNLRGRTAVICAGDIISDVDYASVLAQHTAAGSTFTIVLNPVPETEVSRFGTAAFRPTEGTFGRITEFREKKAPREALQSIVDQKKQFLNNSSIYVLDPEIFLRPLTIIDQENGETHHTRLIQRMFPNIDPQFLRELIDGKVAPRSQEEATACLKRFGHPAPDFNDFGTHLLPQLASNRLLNGVLHNGYWTDIGTPESYWFANWHALAGRFKVQIPFPEVSPGIWVHPEADIPDLRAIKPPAVIAGGVRLGNMVEIGPRAVIGSGWDIRKGAKVTDSILLQRYGSDSDYPPGTKYQVIHPGSLVHRSIIAGILPLSVQTFKTVWGDGAPNPQGPRCHTTVPLYIPQDSDTAIRKQTTRLLLADKPGHFLDKVEKLLRNNGWQWLEAATTPASAAEKMDANKYDLIIMDFSELHADPEGMPEGAILLRTYRCHSQARNSGTPTLFWSRQPNPLANIDGMTIARMTESGVVVRSKNNPEVALGRLSDFLLKLLKEQ
ncbi:MAG: sugar phosphate nucleotidyltransferase [Candidatus Margulisbacteria bacterium]|jgi:NDP-sugar pyrophosphorylase family protein|nr:sugar phosphate nucleotidyltransferase [Candidatus Margulisiibacteriota bacterium]